jgi:polysaccharide pyruvyl transferase WcaK-like protein
MNARTKSKLQAQKTPVEMPRSGPGALPETGATLRRPYSRAFQICNGLGAGNIGDDLMARAFWSQYPQDMQLDVAVFPMHVLQRERYPERFKYVISGDKKSDNAAASDTPGLLVGSTVVTEIEEIAFPLLFVADRLDHFARKSLPVDAVGVGVDYLHSNRARELFARSFHSVRSWSVRSSYCRDALLDLSVPDEKILVCADLSWLYKPEKDLRHWGAGLWQSIGIDPNRSLLVANVVNLNWRSHVESKRQIAAAFDRLQEVHGYQIAFFCNECREGELFDRAAAEEVKALMRSPAKVVPNFYWSPDEVLGLLSHADVAISQRYHFAILPVLCGTVPVSIVRGRKMRGLVEDLGLEASCTISNVDCDRLVHEVMSVHQNRPAYLKKLSMARHHLEVRAANNLSFFRYFNRPQ